MINLIDAVKKGETKIVQHLLAHGADPNMQDKWRGTALGYASKQGNTEIAQQLLDAGAHIDYSDKNYYTALMLASLSGRVGIVKLLLANGANIKLTNPYGFTALDIAEKRSQSSSFPRGATKTDYHKIINLLKNAKSLSHRRRVMKLSQFGHKHLRRQALKEKLQLEWGDAAFPHVRKKIHSYLFNKRKSKRKSKRKKSKRKKSNRKSKKKSKRKKSKRKKSKNKK